MVNQEIQAVISGERFRQGTVLFRKIIFHEMRLLNTKLVWVVHVFFQPEFICRMKLRSLAAFSYNFRHYIPSLHSPSRLLRLLGFLSVLLQLPRFICQQLLPFAHRTISHPVLIRCHHFDGFLCESFGLEMESPSPRAGCRYRLGRLLPPSPPSPLAPTPPPSPGIRRAKKKSYRAILISLIFQHKHIIQHPLSPTSNKTLHI